MALTATAALMKANAHVVHAPSGGVDKYGLYVETITTNMDGTSSRTYCRYFLVDNCLYSYTRQAGKTRATWRTATCPDPATALQRLNARVNRFTIIRGAPLLVQLDTADLELIKSKMPPGARYRGLHRAEQMFGKNTSIVEGMQFDVPMSQTGVEKAKLLLEAKTVTAAADAPKTETPAAPEAAKPPIPTLRPVADPSTVPSITRIEGGTGWTAKIQPVDDEPY